MSHSDEAIEQMQRDDVMFRLGYCESAIRVALEYLERGSTEVAVSGLRRAVNYINSQAGVDNDLQRRVRV